MNALRMTLAETAAAVDGELRGGSPATVAQGVSTDSRTVTAGELFVALAGERFDAHGFLAQVAAAGAVAAIVEAARVSAPAPLPLIAVGDTRVALRRLAAAWRARFRLPLVGITGSNGKTTTKEMLAAILRAHLARLGLPPAGVLATRGNLNNEIGVPLMLFDLSPATRFAVIEMGMSHPGEIAELAAVVAPTVGLVTNAQRAHLAGVGSLDAVAREKGALFAGLVDDGVAVVNADDPHAALWKRMAGSRRIVEASFGGPGDVVGRHDAAGALEIVAAQGAIAVRLQVPGRHNARNAVLAAAAALAAGAGLADVAQGLNTFAGVPGRLAVRPGLAGARLLDDSYNANPDSVRAAIDVLAAQPGRRVLVFGDMGETGAQQAAVHAEVGDYARQAGIDTLYALGEASTATVRTFGADARHFASIEELVDALRAQLAPGVVVLVKGSRFMRMERVVAGLAAASAPDETEGSH